MKTPRPRVPAWLGESAPRFVRAAVTAVAASMAVAPLLDGLGTAVVAGGAVLGVAVGERAHRSSVRTAPGVAGLAVVCAIGLALAHGLTRSGVGVDVFGLVGSLRLGQWARLAGVTFAVVSVLRLAAARVQLVRGLEVLALAAACVVPFAAHRGGFVARPLWLGDLASRAGVPPESALLAAGSMAALALATLLVLEARRRISPATWIAAPALAVLVVASVDVVGVPQVEPPADLGLTRWTDGEAALPHDPGGTPGQNPGGRDGDGRASDGDGEGASPGVPPGPSAAETTQRQGEGPGPAPAGPPAAQGHAGEGHEDQGRASDGRAQPRDDGSPSGTEPSGTEPSGAESSGAESSGTESSGTESSGTESSDAASGDRAPSDTADEGADPRDGADAGSDETESAEGADPPPSSPEPPAGSPSSDTPPPPDDTPPLPDDTPPPPSGTPTDTPPPPDDAPPPLDDPLEPPPDLEDRRGGASSAPRPMAVIVLGDDYEPPEQSWYLRQDAWATFTGNRLVASRSLDAPRDGFARFPVGRDVVANPPPPDDRVLVRGTVSVLQQHAAPFGLVSPVALEPAQNPDPTQFVRSWAFESLALAVEPATLIGRVAGDPAWTASWWDEVLEHPDDPRWSELADEIVQSLPDALRADPWAQAVAIKLWMDAEVTYSMANTRLEGPDPAGDFLFGDRVGYCVHIAHAAVFLMRARGVPARVGTGYAVPASQRRGSVLVATAADAHAWPEVYLEGVGWVVIDIAPQQVEDTPGEPLDDAVFDRLAELARQDPTTDASSLAPPKRAWRPMQAAQTVLRVLLRLLGLAVAVLYVVKLWRRAAPLYARPDAVPRVAYRAALDVLVEAGVRRAFGEPRADFAARVAADVPSLPALTRAHLRWAFGPRAATPTADEARALVALAARVRREVAASRPMVRRVLGALDPTSFLRTR